MGHRQAQSSSQCLSDCSDVGSDQSIAREYSEIICVCASVWWQCDGVVCIVVDITWLWLTGPARRPDWLLAARPGHTKMEIWRNRFWRPRPGLDRWVKTTNTPLAATGERERESLLEWANWGLWTIFPASCELIALFQLIKKSSRTAMAIISALSSLMRFLITLATQINVNLLEYTGGWWTSRPSLELDDIWWLKRYLSYLIKGQVM